MAPLKLRCDLLSCVSCGFVRFQVIRPRPSGGLWLRKNQPAQNFARKSRTHARLTPDHSITLSTGCILERVHKAEDDGRGRLLRVRGCLMGVEPVFDRPTFRWDAGVSDSECHTTSTSNGISSASNGIPWGCGCASVLAARCPCSSPRSQFALTARLHSSTKRLHKLWSDVAEAQGSASVKVALNLSERRTYDMEVQSASAFKQRGATSGLGGSRLAGQVHRAQASVRPHEVLELRAALNMRPAAGGACSERSDGKRRAIGITGVNPNYGCGASMTAQPQAVGRRVRRQVAP